MNIKRVIVSRTDKIGDLILSIPSFFMIKKMYPQAELVVLVRKYNYEIVKNLPYVDRIIKIDDYTHSELIEKIVYFKADIFIALYNDRFVSQLAKASKSKIKIGPLSKLYSFFAFNKYDWMLESGDNICSIPSVSGEDRILQAMIAAFFLLTPLIILILRKLFMREMFEFWLYVFSLVICLGCGWWLFWGRFIFCY